jgi:hypothetical protein
MLTMDNTEGFTQDELDKMNDEVEEYFKMYWPTMTQDDANYYECLQWAEEKVLKKYGGA